MALLLGESVSPQKTIYNTLKSKQGFGKHRTSKFISRYGIQKKATGKKLESYFGPKIYLDFQNNREYLNEQKPNAPVGKDHTKWVNASFAKELRMNSFKAQRIRNGLPVRGQRSRANGNTAKKQRVSQNFIKYNRKQSKR